MKYTVVWTDGASADLWELWSSPANRSAVMASAQRIEELLEQNPFGERHEVVNNSGTAMLGPLGVDYLIDIAGRRVYVTAAWPASEDE